MNTILLQICKEFINEVTQYLGQRKALGLEEIETTLKKKTDTFILNMIKTYLEELDQSIVEDKTSRKQQGFVVQRRGDKREQYLLFGPLSFKRTYFYNKRKKEYAYLLDQAVGLERYERVSNNVALELVEHAAESSYGESSRHVTNGAISRQTVMKKLRKLKNLKIANPSPKRQVKVLYVNADEDHISLQNGNKAIVPLISIHEGIQRQGKRGKCINPHYISSYGKPIEDLWLEAAKWIDETYDVDYLERIYLHGDGASWIKEGLNWLPSAKIVLDRYHLNKAITTATARQPEKRSQLYLTLSKNNKEAFTTLTQQLRKDAKDDSEQKRIQDFYRYINNNWAGITIHSQENCGRSCTEGHVSHVLSSRLSSRPMGWGREGLRVMAELRAYKSSGGKIEIKHLKDMKTKYKIRKSIFKKTKKLFSKVTKEQLDNIPILSQGKIVPMFGWLRGLQNGDVTL